MANSIYECLSQMTALTKKNIEILKTLNDAFYTKKNHLVVNVDDNNYVIPSFLSLENKIDILQQNLDNIVNAPLTGEAFTYFDGTTQKIELSGFQTYPNHIDLNTIKNFGVDSSNKVFKDFLSPNPFIKIDLSSISNNIKHVSIRKIVLNESIYNFIKSEMGFEEDISSISYEDVYKRLDNYRENVDYEMYDSIRRLPLRSNNEFGEYEIVEIVDTYTDSNFDEFYELKLNKDLTYFIKNGTIERNLRIGDTLVTNNDKVMLLITDISPTSRTIKVRVMYGAYANLCDAASSNPDLYKLKFYKSVDFDASKYIEVPLEEDDYICVFVSAINDTTNTQSPWGSGLMINTSQLTMEADGGEVNFKEYYIKNVNNIGDTLYSLTNMLQDEDMVDKLDEEEFNRLTSLQPIINQELITVTQINKHLNDSEAVKNIRNLYNQKTQLKNDIQHKTNEISTLKTSLNNITFELDSDTRSLYKNQIDSLNSEKKELNNQLSEIIREISESANSSDTPIENAKYRIRGFIDISEFENNNYGTHVIKLQVEYRYKNKNKFVGNAESIGDGYIYSDWNIMDSSYRKRIASFDTSINKFIYKFEPTNENINLPSFNQIDIPITQGESVDIRVRFVYNLGYPFVEMTSGWSNIYNVEFPEEYIQKLDVLDIITENNDDVKKNHFNNILEQQGIIDHTSDYIQDQTITYFHQPEHIASGYYTDERRVIPLKDKLDDMIDIINDLQSEVYGSMSENLVVVLSNDNTSMVLQNNIMNVFTSTSYDKNSNKESYGSLTDVAYEQINVTLYNQGKYNIKLHSLFPGDYNEILNSNTYISNEVLNYSENDNNGVWMMLDEGDGKTLQRLNQWLYFRYKDPIYGRQNIQYPQLIYGESSTGTGYTNTVPKRPNGYTLKMHDSLLPLFPPSQPNPNTYGSLFPYPSNLSDICIGGQNTFYVLGPGESINIPLSFYYKTDGDKIVRLIEFDVRTSLYKDPTTYRIMIEANKTDKISRNVKTIDSLSLNPIKLNNSKLSLIGEVNKVKIPTSISK